MSATVRIGRFSRGQDLLRDDDPLALHVGRFDDTSREAGRGDPGSGAGPSRTQRPRLTAQRARLLQSG